MAEAKLLRLSVLGDAASVSAGDKLQLVVELADKPSDNVTVIVTNQRLVMSFGGYPELWPTHDYFEVYPDPITVYTNHRYGLSNEFKLGLNPTILEPDPPIAYPEHLLFTAWIEGDPTTFQSVAIRVEEPIPRK